MTSLIDVGETALGLGNLIELAQKVLGGQTPDKTAENQRKLNSLRNNTESDFKEMIQRVEHWTNQLTGPAGAESACRAIDESSAELNAFHKAAMSNLYDQWDTVRAKSALSNLKQALEYNRSKCERVKRRESEGLGLARRGAGMCDKYLDWLNSLQPRDLMIATSQPNLFSCTAEGVRRWVEKKKRQEEEARQALERMREEQGRQAAQLQMQRMSCHQPPGWVMDRIANNPQQTTLTGPSAPLAVPFTPEEVRSAVLKVLSSGDSWLGQIGWAAAMGANPPSGCARGEASAADVRIADFVAKHLRFHHAGRGWIKITIPYAPGARGGRVQYIDLPRRVEMMFGNGGLHTPGSQQGVQAAKSYFDMDNFNTTFNNQLRLQRMPAYLRQYGRPVFSPQAAQQQAQPSEAQRIAALEERLRMLQQGPEPDRPEIRPRTREEQLMMQIRELEQERFGAAPARAEVPVAFVPPDPVLAAVYR